VQFLWTKVGYCADDLFKVVCVLRLDQAEISYHWVPLLVDENVLKFKVIKNNAQLVQILQSQNDSCQHETNIILIRLLKNRPLSRIIIGK
jgi:hypothetical protein